MVACVAGQTMYDQLVAGENPSGCTCTTVPHCGTHPPGWAGRGNCGSTAPLLLSIAIGSGREVVQQFALAAGMLLCTRVSTQGLGGVSAPGGCVGGILVPRAVLRASSGTHPNTRQHG